MELNYHRKPMFLLLWIKEALLTLSVTLKPDGNADDVVNLYDSMPNHP